MKTTARFVTAAGAALALGAAAHALPYTWETYAKYVTGDASIDNLDVDSSNIGVGATYYFPGSGNRDGAFRELPYLNRASWINAEFDIGDLDDSVNNAFDTNAFRAEGLYVDRGTGWYGGLGLVVSDADREADSAIGIGFNGVGSEFNAYSIRGGRYIFENTTIELAYTRIDVNRNDVFTQTGVDSDVAGLAFKHYGPLTDSIGYSFSASYYLINFATADWDDFDDDPFDDDGQVYSVEGVVYPMRELGIGLGYTDANDLHGRPFVNTVNQIYDGVGIFAEWFATESLSLRAQYVNSDYEVTDPLDIDRPNDVENDALSFRVGYRF